MPKWMACGKEAEWFVLELFFCWSVLFLWHKLGNNLYGMRDWTMVSTPCIWGPVSRDEVSSMGDATERDMEVMMRAKANTGILRIILAEWRGWISDWIEGKICLKFGDSLVMFRFENDPFSLLNVKDEPWLFPVEVYDVLTFESPHKLCFGMKRLIKSCIVSYVQSARQCTEEADLVREGEAFFSFWKNKI